MVAFASRVEFARTRRYLTFFHLLVERVHFAMIWRGTQFIGFGDFTTGSDWVLNEDCLAGWPGGIAERNGLAGWSRGMA